MWRSAEARHVVLGEINAILAEIYFDILPEIYELQRRTDGVRAREVGRAGLAVQVQHQPPDGIGRAAAVIHELAEVRVARLDDVLREGVEQIVKGLVRQRVSGDHPRQVREQVGVARASRLEPAQRVAIAVEERDPPGRGNISLVCKIVRAPREPVDDRHGMTQPRRKQQRCDRKILVVTDGHCPIFQWLSVG
jgi:hypothetical protein